jgi:hypothetical protein
LYENKVWNKEEEIKETKKKEEEREKSKNSSRIGKAFP